MRHARINGTIVTLFRNVGKVRVKLLQVWPEFNARSPQHAGRIAKAWERNGRMPLGLRGGR